MILYIVPGLAAGFAISLLILAMRKLFSSTSKSVNYASGQNFLVVGIAIWLVWTVFCYLLRFEPVPGYIAVSWGFFFSWLTVWLGCYGHRNRMASTTTNPD